MIFGLDSFEPRIVVRAYHCGSRLIGKKFSFDYFGTGAGASILGPGIYFASVPHFAHLYCEYPAEPWMYTVELDVTDYYDPVHGVPERMRDLEERLSAAVGRDLSKVRGSNHSLLQHGKRPFGQAVALLGTNAARDLLVKLGVRGSFERLPTGLVEYAAFDLNTVAILDARPVNALGAGR